MHTMAKMIFARANQRFLVRNERQIFLWLFVL